MSTPFYDPTRTYEENYRFGPFGDFRTLPKKMAAGESYELFGIPIDVPFGIPAGPLLTSTFITGAWNWGFSIATYKTVRGNVYPCHPFPNVITVISRKRDIYPGDIVIGKMNVKGIHVARDGITNSFGVPSKDPEVWQADVKKALKVQKKGNVMILSFMGTKQEDMSRDEYIDDFVKTCRLAKATGASILEVNFSCPNFGKEGLICNDVRMSSDILEALHRVKGNIPLLVKIGYFSNHQRDDADKLLHAIHRFADGVVAINTVPAKVVDKKGNQVLPGSPVRLFSGTCGSTIRWAGLEMSEYMVEYKKRKGWKDFVVIGVGGVTTPEDYFRYMKLGVDAVQSATGAMWRQNLALKIRKKLTK